MADSMSRAEMVTRLVASAGAHGMKAGSADDRTVSGTLEAIKSKWFLGGRKVSYRMACSVDEPSRTVRFREAAIESSWGIPPPTLTVEKTTQRGTRVNEARTDRGAGGGGHLDYGGLREALEQTARDGGWRFIVDLGKMP